MTCGLLDEAYWVSTVQLDFGLHQLFLDPKVPTLGSPLLRQFPFSCPPQCALLHLGNPPKIEPNQGVVPSKLPFLASRSDFSHLGVHLAHQVSGFFHLAGIGLGEGEDLKSVLVILIDS